MKHYTKEELSLYKCGDMSILGRLQCAAHLKRCPKCKALMRELREDDALIVELRESLRLYRELSAPGAGAASRGSASATR